MFCLFISTSTDRLLSFELLSSAKLTYLTHAEESLHSLRNKPVHACALMPLMANMLGGSEHYITELQLCSAHTQITLPQRSVLLVHT